jgi:hypothetical protein
VSSSESSRLAPQVGIFWFIQQPGEAPILVGSGVPVAHGKRYRNFITYPGDHVHYWSTVKPQVSEVFSDSEYDDWPRGRVSYDIDAAYFRVFLNEQLKMANRQGEIIAFFNLPERKTSFSSDPHYAKVRFVLGPAGPRDTNDQSDAPIR